MIVAAENQSGGGSLMPLLLLLGVFALMYFMVIRPQSQRRKQMQQMQSTVGPGAPVMTLGGLYGSVVSVNDESVVIEVAPGVTNRYARAAIAKVLSDEEAAQASLSPAPTTRPAETEGGASGDGDSTAPGEADSDQSGSR